MFLRDMWYFALPSKAVRPGTLAARVLLGEPIVFARTMAGTLYALKDICPHRGVPLSAGKLQDNEVECPYHGWRFRADGRCAHIPSLVEGQDLDPAKISVRTYPVHEGNGLIWIYMAEDAKAAPAIPPPSLPLGATDPIRMQEVQTFPCALDNAVVGLMDPAHGPFVHKSWWWRSRKSIHAKAKNFAPSDKGFTMVAHKPSRNSTLYRVLGGDLTTEITFTLPSVRIERILAGRHSVLSLTTCTPVTENETEVTQTFYWNLTWGWLIRPLFRPFASEFLSQDRRMVTIQQAWTRFNPRQMLIQDADTPALWYFRLKKEWAAARGEGREFVNPLEPAVLRWRS